jgi:hypothetical protein
MIIHFQVFEIKKKHGTVSALQQHLSSLIKAKRAFTGIYQCQRDVINKF